MLFDGLTAVANPCRLLSEPSFKAFVSPIVDERGTFGERQDLEAAIMEVGVLQTYVVYSVRIWYRRLAERYCLRIVPCELRT